MGRAGMPWVSHCLHAWDERTGRGFAPSVCEVVCVGCPSLMVCDGCMVAVGALEMPDDSLGLGALFVLWFEACILGGGTQQAEEGNAGELTLGPLSLTS